MQYSWGFTEIAKPPALNRWRRWSTPSGSPIVTCCWTVCPTTNGLARSGSARLREQFESDLAIEYEVVARPQTGVVSRAARIRDSTSAALLEGILADEEEHIDYLETQLQLMDTLGEELYCAQCVSRPPS